ncbi:MAG: thiol peroxidase [Nitrospiraceae bacterium]|nr:thiol peroxidase [Nitrospiraceae bacterium]
MERKGIVAFMGNPLTLTGAERGTGGRAPGFTVLDADMKEVRLSDFAGKIKVISVTPSLDTPVCDLQARRFNQEAANLPADVIVLNISMDLPFAIARFCAQAGIDRVKALSDHREASFGTAYGVLIRELRLLARSIFIIDRNDVIRYVQVVPELTDHPDYDGALAALREIGKAGTPGAGTVPPVVDDKGYLLDIDAWDESVAAALAAKEGLKGLTKDHIDALVFIREHYRKYSAFPIVNAVCRNIHQPNNCLSEDFMTPMLAWKLAGLPRPDELVVNLLEYGQVPT